MVESIQKSLLEIQETYKPSIPYDDELIEFQTSKFPEKYILYSAERQKRAKKSRKNKKNTENGDFYDSGKNLFRENFPDDPEALGDGEGVIEARYRMVTPKKYRKARNRTNWEKSAQCLRSARKLNSGLSSGRSEHQGCESRARRLEKYIRTDIKSKNRRKLPSSKIQKTMLNEYYYQEDCLDYPSPLYFKTENAPKRSQKAKKSKKRRRSISRKLKKMQAGLSDGLDLEFRRQLKGKGKRARTGRSAHKGLGGRNRGDFKTTFRRLKDKMREHVKKVSQVKEIDLADLEAYSAAVRSKSPKILKTVR